MKRDDCPYPDACPLAGGANPAWNYCSKCGSRARELQLTDEIDPAVADEDGVYRMPLTGADPSLQIVPEDPQKLVDFLGVEKSPFGFFLKLDLARIPDGEAAHMLLKSDDGPRQDLWTPRPQRTRSVRLVHRVAKTQVDAIPGVGVFLGEIMECAFDLENRGFTVARFGPPHIPAGFEFADARDMAGFEIAPGDRRKIRVRRKVGALTGSIVFMSPAGVELTTVKLLPIAAPALRTPPGLVVSIDFGTSNTSVFCLETRTGIVESISLMGDGKERRETVLYAPDNVDPRYWQAFQEGVMAKDVLRDLKTLVRDRTAGSTARLQFYLRAILLHGIAAYLEGRNPGDERTVEFVFTVPVLDGVDGPDHVHYRETLLGCARAAGYEDPERGWKIRWMLEPDGGALEVVSIPELSRRMTDGDRMLIMDVGGGTTDVTLGRVRLTGRPRLDEIENVSVLSNDDQFGGEMATYILGWRWVKADAEGVLPTGPDRGRIGQENERIKTKNLVDYGWLSDPARRAEAERWEYFDEVERHPNPEDWGSRFADLWTTVRAAKHQLSNDSAKWVEQLWKVAAYTFDSKKPGPRLDWKVTPLLLDSALEKPIGDICSGIQQFLQERQIPLGEIKHVAMIGGSARLQALREAIAKLFPNRLLPLGSYVDVAVCRGASRLYQAAPPILPIGFEFVIGKDICLELVRPGASLAKVIRRIQPLESPRGVPVEALLRCILPDGSTLPYLSLRFDNGFSGEVLGSVSSGAVTLEARAGNGKTFGYEVKLL
jgi:hypothetical protein